MPHGRRHYKARSRDRDHGSSLPGTGGEFCAGPRKIPSARIGQNYQAFLHFEVNACSTASCCSQMTPNRPSGVTITCMAGSRPGRSTAGGGFSLQVAGGEGSGTVARTARPSPRRRRAASRRCPSYIFRGVLSTQCLWRYSEADQRWCGRSRRIPACLHLRRNICVMRELVSAISQLPIHRPFGLAMWCFCRSRR